MSTLIISLALLLRGAVFLATKENFKDYSTDADHPVYQILTFIFGDLIPICSQASSLVFGYISNKQNKNYLTKQTDSIYGNTSSS